MDRVLLGALCLLLLLAAGCTQGQSQTTNFTRPVFLCGGHLVTDSGYLGSEGFPNPYKPNKKCTWYITVPDGHVVMLSFRIFDLEADPRCQYDFVDVYNGHSYMAQKLGRFCGTFRPGAIISTSNTMMVEMVTDSSTGGRGFVAYFTGGKPHVDEHQFCGGRLTKAQGSIKTPNWPDSNYPAGISCSWYISAEPGKMIEVKFDKLDLEGDSYCRYDYVAFFNGGETDDSRRIGKYCGNTVPEPIITNGNELLVQFVSDLSVTSDGFLATYTSIPRGSKLPTTADNVVPGVRVESRPSKPSAKPARPVRPAAKPQPTPRSPVKPAVRPAKPTPRKPSLNQKPKTTPKPRVKPTHIPRIKPTAKPGSKPGNKVLPKPTAKPKTTSKTKPTAKPRAKPLPKPKATAKAATKPILKPNPKHTGKPTTKPTQTKPKVVKSEVKKSQTPAGKQPAANNVNPLCSGPCLRNGTIQSRFCSSHYVITGKVTAISPGPGGSVSVSVSIIKAYKAGRLLLGRAAGATSVTLLSTCGKCPLLHKGVSYVFMGQVDKTGRGTLLPSSFALPFKKPQEKLLSSLASKAC